MGRGDNTGALPLHDYLVLLLIIHRAYARSELHHFCGRAEAADACEGPAAPDPAGARDKLRTVQREQGLGGPEQDGRMVRLSLLSSILSEGAREGAPVSERVTELG